MSTRLREKLGRMTADELAMEYAILGAQPEGDGNRIWLTYQTLKNVADSREHVSQLIANARSILKMVGINPNDGITL